MIDAGSLYPKPEAIKYVVPPRPDDSRSPAEWIARYVKRHLRGIREPAIDVFVATHFHGDHIGELRPGGKRSSDGSYELTGVTELESLLRVDRLVDRGHPDYSYPVALEEDYQRNYIHFVRSFRHRGGTVERLVVGSDRQLRLLRNRLGFPEFSIRNIAANGDVWSGHGDAARRTFPPLETLARSDYPTENMCSIALRVQYGEFDYFSPADLTGDTRYGRLPWRDIETAAARAAGPVEVAVASHHGYVDATSPSYVAALRPRVFIIPGWDSAHPTIPALDNMLSTELYPGPRDIFSTATKPENLIATRRLSNLASAEGHIVIRVARGGASYRIFVLGNGDEADTVQAVFGPYDCGR
jgi:hypothetical protein